MARYLLLESKDVQQAISITHQGQFFLLVGNMPTVKYILKKTVGSLEREIKYCTY